MARAILVISCTNTFNHGHTSIVPPTMDQQTRGKPSSLMWPIHHTKLFVCESTLSSHLVIIFIVSMKLVLFAEFDKYIINGISGSDRSSILALSMRFAHISQTDRHTHTHTRAYYFEVFYPSLASNDKLDLSGQLWIQSGVHSYQSCRNETSNW